MASHAPHVRTKRPLRGRRVAAAAPSTPTRIGALRHAHPARRLESRLARRGPSATATVDPKTGELAFTIASGGVILGATILGIILGLAHPTWMLAAALVGTGALLATLVVVRGRHVVAPPTVA